MVMVMVMVVVVGELVGGGRMGSGKVQSQGK
jgi:hypothetical protein